MFCQDGPNRRPNVPRRLSSIGDDNCCDKRLRMNDISRILFLLCALALSAGGCATLRGSYEPTYAGPTSSDQAMQYFIKAKVFEAQHNYLGAIVALRNAADLDPTSPTIYARLAYNYQRIDDAEVAVHFALKGLALDGSQVRLRRLLIRILESEGDREGAIDHIEELLRYEPDNWPLYRHLAYLYFETGQTKRIAPLFKEVLAQEHVPPEVKVDIAVIFSRINQQEEAERIYRRVLAADPMVEDAWLGLAELKLAQGYRHEAIAIYREAAAHLPDSSVLDHLARLMVTERDLEDILAEESAEVLYHLGVALSEAGQYDQATLVFKRIIEMQPQTVEQWTDLARYYIYLEDYDSATAVLSQAAEAMPDSSHIYLYWGTALEKTERYDEAIAVYQRGLQHLPDAVELYLYWGLALEQQDAWAEAIDVYRQALAASPGHAALHVRWGISLGRQEQWEDSLAQYETAASLDSAYSPTFLHWGIALEELEHWEAALEKLNEAVVVANNKSRVLFYLGSCYEQASRKLDRDEYFDRAVETFQRLLEIEPNDAYALNYLGYMYADKGVRLTEAVALLEKAIALQPDNSAFLDSIGWAYFRLGELAQAEHYLQQALDHIDEGDPEEQAVIFDHAGDIANALDKMDEARVHWLKVLELAPDNEEVQRKLLP